MKALQLMIFIGSFLFTNPADAQTVELNKTKALIAEMLKNKYNIYETSDPTSSDNRKFHNLGSPTNVLVLDDRIEISFKNVVKSVYFDENPIKYPASQGVHLKNFEFKQGNDKRWGSKAYRETEKANSENGNDNQLFESLNLMCYIRYDTQLTQFEPTAEKYRTLTVKPTISEAQREFIVQANLLNQQKRYDKAIELYNRAIELDPTSYPAAYSNLALLSAQLRDYNFAIYSMKKYLMLVPEAEDARSAQDKIYEWKMSLEK